MTLYDMALGSAGAIVRLGESGAMRRRLLDIGFTQGAQVRWAALCWACIRFKRPTGRVRGALVALRQENARNIFVEG